jgi:hypothetical protein
LFASTVYADVFRDDFTDGLNLPWLFIDDLGDSPPEFTNVSFNDADQNLKFIGSATDYDESMDLSVSTTGYVGLGNPDYFFENDVYVSATFSPLENLTLGFEESELGNNDVYVVARGEGLTGYIFALDAYHGEADLVRVDDGAIVALGDEAVLRDLKDVDQDGTYTLRLSAVGNVLTGQVFDESMALLGEVSIEEDTYSSGWAGLGAAINDGGDEFLRTLIATSFDDFLASDTLDIDVEPPTIDELSEAIRNGSTDARFDIDDNGTVDPDDRGAWVTVLNNTYFGDSNLDGEFNSSDFVVVFTAGEYEDGIAGNSLWSEGDWDGDGDFSSSDFVLAFTGRGYEVGPRAPQAVPEPNSICLVLLGFIAVMRTRATKP